MAKHGTLYSGDLSVERGRDAYLSENGWTVAAYDEPTTEVSVFGWFKMRFPNTRAHSEAIRLHDLHHVATGYGTDHVGEAEISAWELKGLFQLDFYVGSIVVSGVLLGLLMAPRRTWRAFASGRKARPLFGHFDRYPELLKLDVQALRHELGVPPEGLVKEPQRLHAFA